MNSSATSWSIFTICIFRLNVVTAFFSNYLVSWDCSELAVLVHANHYSRYFIYICITLNASTNNAFLVLISLILFSCFGSIMARSEYWAVLFLISFYLSRLSFKISVFLLIFSVSFSKRDALSSWEDTSISRYSINYSLSWMISSSSWIFTTYLLEVS